MAALNMTAMHLAAPMGSGAVEAFTKMGVNPATLNGLEASGLSWSSVWTLALTFFQIYGSQVFQVILDIVTTLEASGFSEASIMALATKDGGALKTIVVGILTAFGKQVPAVLS